jgi:two-component system, OmpR family, sensor kinase
MSIRFRFTLFYTAILTAFFVCFSLFSYFVVRTTLLSALDSTLEKSALTVVNSTEVFQSDNQNIFINLPEGMDMFQTATLFMMALNAQGEVLAQTANLAEFEGVLDANALGTTEPLFHSVTEHSQPLRVYTYPLLLETGEGEQQRLVGYLQVATLLESYNQAMSQLFLVLVLTGGVVFFFFLALSTATTNSWLRPLTEITTVAMQISRADDLGRRLPDEGRDDEIGHLTLTLNQTFERLETLFRNQQRFLADVSHELRTPLTTVRGNIDLMRRFGEYDPELLDIIQDELQRMTRLVGDLLLLARADGGSLPIARQAIDLETVILDIYRQVQPLQESQQVMVRLGSLMPVRIMGDADRIKQLLLILVDNGMKYTPAGGEVVVSLTRVADTAVVSIQDNGPGIAAQHIPFIFDRFYRVDKSRTRALGGSGLGLSIAKWIAEVHGGTIRVESELGKGSKFMVLLTAVPHTSTEPIEQYDDAADEADQPAQPKAIVAG